MKDRLGIEITRGCSIVYPGRAGGSAWNTTARVLEVHHDKLVVTSGSRGFDWNGEQTKELGMRTIRCLRDVLVTAGTVVSVPAVPTSV